MELDIRGVKYEIDDELKDFIGRRMRLALGRFEDRVGRVIFRISDVNGPRGGIDKRCRVDVALIPSGVVRVEGSGDDPFALAALSARRAGRSVRRTLERRRQMMCA